MSPELAAQYRDLLSETQQKLHDRAWVNVLQQMAGRTNDHRLSR
jgi:hypothetical protein